MKREALNKFLSSDNIDLHCGYLKQLRLKLSIIRKSYPELLSGNAISQNRRMIRSVPDEVIFDAKCLLNNIKVHEVYFNSFATKREKCPNLKGLFGSEEAFLYELYGLIKSAEHGYALIYINEKGKIRFSLSDTSERFVCDNPLIAIDLYEHSYFYDYLYDKDRYYRCAVENIDLGKIEEALSSS